MKLFWIMFAGALGTGARYGIGLGVKKWLHGAGSQSWAGQHLGTTFPLDILLINVAGALLLSMLAFGLAAKGRSDYLLPILGTGFCGGFTTFSTFALDAERLWRLNWRLALVYIGSNLVLGFGAVLLGRVLVLRLFGGAK